MLRRSLFVSTLMLAGVVGFASSAKAQVNGTILFNGKVSDACAFGSSFEGALAAENGTNRKLVTNTPGTIEVNCSTGNLQITNISTTAAIPTPETELNIKSTLMSAGNSTTTMKNAGVLGAPGAVVTAPADGVRASVTLEVDKLGTTPLNPGNYDFIVTVTATK